MTAFVLVKFKDIFVQIELAISVAAIRNGIPSSSHNFFNVLERYGPDTCTFSLR